MRGLEVNPLAAGPRSVLLHSQGCPHLATVRPALTGGRGQGVTSELLPPMFCRRILRLRRPTVGDDRQVQAIVRRVPKEHLRHLALAHLYRKTVGRG